MDPSSSSQPASGLPHSAAVDASAERWRARSPGADAHIAAGLSYLPLVGPVLFVREKRSDFVRFHAAQATLLSAAFAALFLVRAAVFAVLDRNQSLVALFLGQGIACVFGLVTLAFVGIWLWGLIAGCTGRYTILPLIGELAERWAENRAERWAAHANRPEW